MSNYLIQFKLQFNPTYPIDSCYRVGSSVTCEPPVNNTDEDWLILVPDLRWVINELHEACWKIAEDEQYISTRTSTQNLFVSAKKDRFNLLVTEDIVFYTRFVAASLLSKEMNLLNKTDRVNLHSIILYGMTEKEYKGPIP